jgi:hypothetical protein
MLGGLAILDAADMHSPGIELDLRPFGERVGRDWRVDGLKSANGSGGKPLTIR